MNKYKMISICSLTIAVLLMLSILLPIRTIANDKESIEIKMHYENSQVTANITVNSDVYTSIVCKYLMIEDVLKCDDILSQTRDNGKTISLDKSEDGKYQVTIPNVDKRYVVVYVSIGNCSLCDYIDCKPKKAEEKKEEPKNENQDHNMEVKGEGENGQKAEAQTNNNDENKPVEEKKEENNEKPAEEPKKEESKQAEENKPAEEQKQENNNKPAEQNNNEQPAQNGENNNEQLVVDNANSKANEFQAIEDVTPPASTPKEENVQNNANKTVTQKQENNDKKSTSTNNENKNVVKNGDKDAIDTTDFEEIEKVISTSTADGDMPQTGEDDLAKILGVVIFSVLSAVSFYKYKTTK